MYAIGNFEPGRKIVPIIGANFTPYSFGLAIGGPFVLASPAPWRDEYEDSLRWIYAQRLPPSLLIIIVSFALNVGVGANFPRRVTGGHKRIALCYLEDPIPASKLDRFFGGEINLLWLSSCEDQSSEQPRK